ncbi:TMEM144, partial [Symbiodinium sp. CCMP2456]
MQAAGFVAVLASALLYGSYFVPAKKYDIRDGLVFQWYQCSGIMLAGLVCAAVRNVWSDDFRSSGFYVAPEGLISGFLFV